MPYVDDRLVAKLSDDSKTAAVLITCSDDSGSVAQELSSNGISVATGADTFGILRAVLDGKGLAVAQTLPGISAIDPDEEVTT